MSKSKQTKNPESKLWQKLYATAVEVKAIAPWEFLRQTDLITILLPDLQEPFYFSASGDENSGYTVACYPGYEALDRFYRQENLGTCGTFTGDVEEEAWKVEFVSREDLTKEEYQRTKDLGYSFRGKHNWLAFRKTKTGYLELPFSERELNLFAAGLENYLLMIKAIAEKRFIPNFDDDMTLVRHYHPEYKQWFEQIVPLDNVVQSVNYPALSRRDQEVVDCLSAIPQVNETIELDMRYVNQPQTDNEGNAYYPVAAILIEVTSGDLCSYTLLNSPEREWDKIADLFDNYVQDTGRPKRVNVRDPRLFALINNLAGAIDVKVRSRKQLPKADLIWDGFERDILKIKA